MSKYVSHSLRNVHVVPVVHLRSAHTTQHSVRNGSLCITVIPCVLRSTRFRTLCSRGNYQLLHLLDKKKKPNIHAHFSGQFSALNCCTCAHFCLLLHYSKHCLRLTTIFGKRERSKHVELKFVEIFMCVYIYIIFVGFIFIASQLPFEMRIQHMSGDKDRYGK